MKLLMINIYPLETISRYLLSSYVLKGYLEKYYEDEIDIDVMNYSVKHDNKKIVEKILQYKPDCVGYSCYGWSFTKIVDIVKTVKTQEDIIHIFGGPEISYNKVEALEDRFLANYYVIGEGEKKLLNLIRFIYKKAPIPDGVIVPIESGLYYQKNISYIANLDEIPSVYLNNVLEDNLYEKQQVFIETQRGCVFKCKYCVYHKGLPQMASYSLQRIFDELDYLILEKKVQALRFCDAVFTLNLNRAKNILKHLICLKKKADNFPWIYWELMYFAIDEEFAELLAQLKDKVKIENYNVISPKDFSQVYSDILMGYKVINCVGIQSFSNEVLKIVGRSPVRRKKLDWFMQLCKKHNIVLKLDIILGLPAETLESYFEGLEYFIPYFENTDHILNIHRLRILPGSELEDLCNKHQIRYLPQDGEIVFSTQTMTEEDIIYASQLSALLFRVINSPFRKAFFELKLRTGKKALQILNEILEVIKNDESLKDSQILTATYVDDVYWNDRIFKEISSAWLERFFNGEKS